MAPLDGDDVILNVNFTIFEILNGYTLAAGRPAPFVPLKYAEG